MEAQNFLDSDHWGSHDIEELQAAFQWISHVNITYHADCKLKRGEENV